MSDRQSISMKYLVILAPLIMGVLSQRAAPRVSGNDKTAQIIRQSSDLNIDGSYQWSFEADNGISAQESGQLKNAGSQDPIGEAQGQFQYVAPDGAQIQITYIANEGGFQPQGAHLPVAPPIPPEILKALEWNAAHPEEEGGGTVARAGRRK